MTAGLVTDLKLYDAQYKGGMYERVAQMIDVLNASSNGTMRMVVKAILGDYEKESFWKKLSSIATRRNLASLAAVADIPLTQDELIGVKCSGKLGPVADAIGALTRVGADMAEMSFVVGQNFGEEKVKDWVNKTLLCLETAIEGQTALNYDATATTANTCTHKNLLKTLALLGDRADRVKLWVMHSLPFYDLVGDAIDQKIVNIADFAIYQASVPTFNRPVLVTDSPSLWDENSSASSGDDTYSILGLVEDASVLSESEPDVAIGEIVSGLEQLIFRIQAEYTFNLRLKGFKWDTSNGGCNPTDTLLGTTTNWDKGLTADKDLCGVRLKVNAA